jgi:uracil-DNA glycosylase family 4
LNDAGLRELDREVIACRRCPRLVAWREEVARVKRASFASEEYWGKPLPGFGDSDAAVLVIGLAPAAHGGNRTGRIFTGDRSGDWLFGSLYRTGFANQPTSVARDDGLELSGAYVGAAVRCAPPANKPTPAERDNCLPYLVRELGLLESVRVIVTLGSFAWDATLRLLAARGVAIPRPRPKFGHGAEREISPEPAEHVHGKADRADDRRCVHAGEGARGPRSETVLDLRTPGCRLATLG